MTEFLAELARRARSIPGELANHPPPDLHTLANNVTATARNVINRVRQEPQESGQIAASVIGALALVLLFSGSLSWLSHTPRTLNFSSTEENLLYAGMLLTFVAGVTRC